MVAVVLIAAAVTAVVVVTVSSDSNSASTPSQSVTTSTITATPTTPAPTTYTPGQAVTNGAVKLTVDSVTTPAALTLERVEDGLSYGDYVDTQPRPGGKYVRVDTTIENAGSKSMDLTCSFPVQAILADTQSRQFTPIDDLYRLQGNPECNDQLQPGFTSKMSYVFEIPTAATQSIFAFADPDTNYNDPALVVIR